MRKKGNKKTKRTAGDLRYVGDNARVWGFGKRIVKHKKRTQRPDTIEEKTRVVLTRGRERKEG